jgi:CBS domain-containing protein
LRYHMPFTIRDAMVTSVVTVEPNYTVKHAVNLMNRFEIGCLVVVEDEKVAGIMTERDVLTRVVAEDRDPEETLVREIMSRPVIVVGPDMPLKEAVKLMVKNRIKKLPVMERFRGVERLVGLVTLTDIARVQPRLIETLKELFEQEHEELPKRMEKVVNYYIV